MVAMLKFFSKRQRPSHEAQSSALVTSLRETEFRYIEILRREIANMIVEVDPCLMARAYDKSWKFEQEINENSVRAQAEESALVAKFSRFSDFDLINARHFVPYYFERKILHDDELVEHYLALSHMLMILRRRDEFVSRLPIHDERERAFLEDRMTAETDRRFRHRMETAVSRFDAYRNGFKAAAGSLPMSTDYEDFEGRIMFLPSFADIRYGIHFKKSDEYGIYSFFVHDNGYGQHSWYRSNHTFEHEKRLPNV